MACNLHGIGAIENAERQKKSPIHPLGPLDPFRKTQQTIKN